MEITPLGRPGLPSLRPPGAQTQPASAVRIHDTAERDARAGADEDAGE